MKKMLIVTVAVMVAAGVSLGWKLAARAAYEAAAYRVELSDGEFELREYPELLVASTNMSRRPDGNDGSFMRLFRYISGDNEGNSKISMTVPVFMEPDADGDRGSMAFVLPAELSETEAPQPTSDQVRLKHRRAGTWAVIRFNGQMTRQTCEAAEQKLRAWLKGRGLSAEETSEMAGYDPPWTPSLLRRNEVLIRLADDSPGDVAEGDSRD